MADVREVIASCPACCTLETLWFEGNVLIPTIKFLQEEDGKVHHGCGTKMPCRLFAVMVDSQGSKRDHRRKVKR